MTEGERRKGMERVFYREIPNVRRMSTYWRAAFEFFYDASLLLNDNTRVLNVICEHDTSAKRETVYRDHFFNRGEYLTVRYWEGKFEHEDEEGNPLGEEKELYHIPYPDGHFDVLVTTKIVMEHVAEPEEVLKEFKRVLKPGGEAFIIAPLIRRQHQAPHDYFRFTEYGLQYLFDKVGFETVYIKNSNGYVETATQYAYFFQRGLNIPKWLEKCFDLFHKWVIEPIGFVLEKLDNGYGRDFTLYFYARVRRPDES